MNLHSHLSRWYKAEIINRVVTKHTKNMGHEQCVIFSAVLPDWARYEIKQQLSTGEAFGLKWLQILSILPNTQRRLGQNPQPTKGISPDCHQPVITRSKQVNGTRLLKKFFFLLRLLYTNTKNYFRSFLLVVVGQIQQVTRTNLPSLNGTTVDSLRAVPSNHFSVISCFEPDVTVISDSRAVWHGMFIASEFKIVTHI